MNRKVYFGQNDIRLVYFRYKDSSYYSLSILLLVIIVCIFLLIYIIVPQIEKYFSIRNEVISQRVRIQTIKDNINFINNVDRSASDTQLKIVTSALPGDQDITGILNAISTTAVSSGVIIGDYKFELGNVQASGSNQSLGEDEKPFSIDLLVVIQGDISRVKIFLTKLSQTLPLSEVTSIENKDNTTAVKIRFYYKDFPEISFKEDEPIESIDIERKQIVEKLSSWQFPEGSDGIIGPVGTNSATPLFE
jgi:hypothetical protein